MTTNETIKKRKHQGSKEDAILYVTHLKNGDDKWLTATQKLVLIMLIQKSRYCQAGKLEAGGFVQMGFTDAGYYTRFTQSDLADFIGIKPKSVSDIIGTLVDKGFIEYRRGFREGNKTLPSCAFIRVDAMAKSWLSTPYKKKDK